MLKYCKTIISKTVDSIHSNKRVIPLLVKTRSKREIRMKCEPKVDYDYSNRQFKLILV